MADEINTSIESTIPTLFEAGTGVGKSFAYLLPAILSGKRTVVSTAKITLQQQLVDKDLPRIQQYLQQIGHPRASFSFAPAYGKNKYACYAECEKEKASAKDWAKYLKFFKHSDYGLWEDADKLHLRLDTNLNANDCIGPDCSHYKTCGYIKSRKTMLAADVVITNNWLLGFHYKLRHTMPHFHLLGEFDHVIVDEAHKVEDGIRTAFTNETSLNALDKIQYRFDRLLDVAHEQFELPELATLDPLWKIGFASLNKLNQAKSNVIDANTSAVIQDLIKGLDDVTNRLLDKTTLDTMFEQMSTFTHTELIRRWITKTPSPAPIANTPATPVGMPPRQGFPNISDDQFVFVSLEKMLELVETSRETFSNILKAPPNRTWMIEQRIFNGKTNLVLKDMPVNIGGYMPDKSVTYVSATLALDNNFDVFADRVGLRGKNYKSDIFPSPFNIRKQAYLYVPSIKDVPEPETMGPKVTAYREAMASQIYELLLACEGDTFVLFTSNVEQDYVKNYLISRGYPHPLIDKATYPTDALARYRATPKATLLGSKSFWEGVDVAGSKLFMVIITKLPFPQQSDPILKARHAAFKGENPWPFIDLPEMLFDLRQGAGRLIRTQKDRGMLVVLDTRLRTKNYKSRAINALGLTPVDNLAMVCKGLRERNG
jgi:ATP-dependent DNA helicase DinG